MDKLGDDGFAASMLHDIGKLALNDRKKWPEHHWDLVTIGKRLDIDFNILGERVLEIIGTHHGNVEQQGKFKKLYDLSKLNTAQVALAMADSAESSLTFQEVSHNGKLNQVVKFNPFYGHPRDVNVHEAHALLKNVVQQLFRGVNVQNLIEKSIELHKELGGEARRYLERILDDELVMGFGPEVFDRYGRALIMLSKRDTEDTYNMELVRTGYAIPYFIYPNAGGPDEKGEFTYETIKRMRAAAIKAQNMNLGIWEHIRNILIPMELRFLTRREFPAKYCADLTHDFLYPPHYYFKVPIPDRLFFYPDDILAAIKMEFRPIPACYNWVHKIWKDYHGKKSWEEGGELNEREKRHKFLDE